MSMAVAAATTATTVTATTTVPTSGAVASGARRLILGSLRRRWPAATLGSLLMLVIAGIALLPPLVMKRIVDDAISRGDLGLLGRLAALLAGLYVVNMLLDFAANAVFLVTGQSVLHEIRRTVFRRVLSLPIEFLERKQTGYLTARLGEISSVGVLFSSGTFKILVSVVEFVGVLVIMLTMNARLTAMLLAFLPLYYVAVRFLSGGYRRASKQLMETGEIMSAKLQETFEGVAEVKNLGAEERRAQEAIRLSDEFVRAGVRHGTLTMVGSQVLILITSLITVAVLYLAGRGIVGGTFTLGGYLAFAGYMGKLLAPFGHLMSYTLTVQPALAALERVGEFLDEVTEEERFSGKPSPGPIERIGFRNVRFAYPSAPDRLALDGVSFAATRPVSLSIVGPNGAGKSTVVKLLLGYYPGYQGQILVNDRELRDLNVLELRRQIAIVSQDPFLFDGTVAENLELATPTRMRMQGAGEERERKTKGMRVEDALAKAQEERPAVARLLERLPQGLATQVGEGGRRLSGGQRQIVAILRALLREADLVVFDEATAHLDEEMRELLREVVQRLFSDKICVILTHDPDLASLTEVEIRLDSGRVVRYASARC
ncbi:MAG: ABC transporter ATP-binding protein [Bacillota bacterium]|nr:ABC transporter ATP-binding protein [Bacillota bacterium]